jgi:hypothetical protein
MALRTLGRPFAVTIFALGHQKNSSLPSSTRAALIDNWLYEWTRNRFVHGNALRGPLGLRVLEYVI